MIKVSYQRHGSVELVEAFFANRVLFDFWFARHCEELSYSKTTEVFH